MLSFILFSALAVPPYPSPPVVTPNACKCGPTCPCKAKADIPAPPVLKAPTAAPKRWTATNGKTYETRADGSNWEVGGVSPPVTQSRPAACYIDANGRKVCPTR